jgi:hypothetical protein
MENGSSLETILENVDPVSVFRLEEVGEWF